MCGKLEWAAELVKVFIVAVGTIRVAVVVGVVTGVVMVVAVVVTVRVV
jgi:hypothetical protein